MTVVRAIFFAAASLGVGCLVVWVLAARATSARLAELDAQSAFIETRHGRIEYSMWGHGPAVLVVHGAGGGFDQGRLLAEAAGGEGFTFIAVSRFGYLGSDLPEDASTAAQAEAFVELLDNLGFDRAHVLAMSGGVPPSIKLAELFPERVGKLVLLSAAPFTPFGPEVEDRPIPTWLYSLLLGNDTVYWALSKIARGQLRQAFDARAKLVDSATLAERAFVEELIDGFLPASRRLAGVNNEGAAVDPGMSYSLESIQAGVSIVHSRDDRLNPVAVAQSLSSGIEGSDLILFDTGGHLLLGHHNEVRTIVATAFASGEPSL